MKVWELKQQLKDFNVDDDATILIRSDDNPLYEMEGIEDYGNEVIFNHI